MTIDLKGSWKLSSTDGKFSNINFSLPGDVHSTLYKANIIPDPYYGCNEEEIQWVAQRDWVATRTFEVRKNFLTGEQFISLESADTFVRVFINETEVGFCSNYFCKWRFNISSYLKEGSNTIKIIFESAERHAIEEASKLPYRVPDQPAPIYSPNRNFVRKTQCHGGWDWGPCIMAIGVYDSIKIEQTNSGFVDYCLVNSKQINDTDWQTDITVTYTSIKNTKATFAVKLNLDKESDSSFTPIEENITVQLAKGENTFTHSFVVKNPDKWYVVGTRPEDTDSILQNNQPTLKNNTLYDLTISYAKSSLTKKIAFRTLEVVAEEDEHGKCLFFRVNGRDIFAKGSNWIPADALPERQTAAKVDSLLTDLVKSNQNCIRVWGGGQYETEKFYELCDRKGILIWQDCMFACSLYPATKEFLESVRKEIRHQVRRLQSHASIAIWCGNNELVGAFGWYEESKTNRDRYLIDYDRLNEGVLGDEINRLDPNRAWWPSSPSAGPNDFSDNWHSDGRGDMHYWSVWHEGKPFEAYYDITPRFVSEFGYQSFPSLETVKTYASEDQFNLTSPVMDFHQKNKKGNSIIIENFTRYFRLPEGFENMLYLSQVQQAMAIHTAVTYWRSLRPHCMGSLIWQLNDVWPVASWASLEYNGKWKLLHYDAREFFSPLYAALYKKNGVVKTVLINDCEKDVCEKLEIKVVNFNGVVQKEFDFTENVSKDSAKEVFSINENELPKNCFVTAKWGNRNLVSIFIEEPKKAPLCKPNIKYAVNQVQNGIFDISLTAEKPAFFVSLDAIGIKGNFSRNMITLLPNQTEVIRFSTLPYVTIEGKKKDAQNISAKRFENALKITSLRDTYK